MALVTYCTECGDAFDTSGRCLECLNKAFKDNTKRLAPGADPSLPPPTLVYRKPCGHGQGFWCDCVAKPLGAQLRPAITTTDTITTGPTMIPMGPRDPYEGFEFRSTPTMKANAPPGGSSRCLGTVSQRGRVLGTVWEKFNIGTVTCNCNGQATSKNPSGWQEDCLHAKFVMAYGCDAPLVLANDSYPRLVDVPMWARDFLHAPVSVTFDGEVSISGGTVIGYVEPTEGRAVIRRMLVEWLGAMHQTIKCKAQYHRAPQFMTPLQIERWLDPDYPLTQLETYLLATVGECSACAGIDNDDLVPNP